VSLAAAGATADITPDSPLQLGGYVARETAFTAVADKLEANVLWLTGPKGRTAFVTTDLLYPGAPLRARLKELLGLGDDELFLAASHTHFAPMTSPGMRALGVPDAAYIERTAQRIAAAARSLAERMTPAQALFTSGVAAHAINRRLICWRLTRSGLTHGAGLGPNPGGDNDERITALRFTDAGGKTFALLWNYACHPTDFPGRLQVSADFPGVVRAKLRAIYGDVPVLFLQGFSGDTRPPFAGRKPGLRGLIFRTLLGPQFRNPGRAEWQGWADSLAARVAGIFASDAKVLPLDGPHAARVTAPEETLGRGGDGSKPLTWHSVDCGGFRVIGVNAEPVTAYRGLVEQRFVDKPLLTAGCIDQTHGYLPVDRMLPEGGYEVEGFRAYFEYRTRFAPGVQDAALAPLFKVP
jgi:hypothetical protein